MTVRAGDLDAFLSQWDDSYLRGQRDIAMFDPRVTARWTREQQQGFVRTFYHVRGHFGEVLWAMGNAVESPVLKNIILANIRDELGGGGLSHERLYLELARQLGVELKDELVRGEWYLPFLRQYNDLQVQAIRTGDPVASVIGFAAGERLDNLDYSGLRGIFESFGLAVDKLGFFTAHIDAEHFEGALAGELRTLWSEAPEKVRDVFSQVRHFQLAMWHTLSSKLCEAQPLRPLTGAAPSNGTTARPQPTSTTSNEDGDAEEREAQYDPARSPALSSKFADVSALDEGDAGRLQLRVDERARALISATRGRLDWGRTSLVLGANGFVGAHILHRLLADARTERVIAIGRSRAGMSPHDRILATWRRYELAPEAVDLAKLTVHYGAVGHRHLGLPSDVYARLTGEVDSVFHCAGSTDYVPPYLELRREWVLGLMGVLQFCLEERAKQITYLGSTIAHLYQEPADFQRPDSWWFSGYTQMKWINQTIMRRMSEHGLRAIVCEAPYVLGSTRVGRDPGFHYSFWRGLRIGAALQLAWDGALPDFAPVDVLADAVVVNALSPKPQPVIRPVLAERQRMSDFAPLLRCKVVSWDQFIEAVSGYANPQQLRLLPRDVPAMIERTNLPAMYPHGFDLGRFPPPRQLAELYLRKLNLI
jgi:thioester reductase-like protein/pyrroloquinoline quinone (PQQ) biosynthesis protein C